MASPLYTVWCDMWPSWYRSDNLHLLSLYRTALAPILSFILEVNIFKSGSSKAMSLIASSLSGMIVIVRFSFQFVWYWTA